MSKQEADEKISLAATGEAKLQAAQANLQRLRELSGLKKIVALFDGIVTARNTDVGQLIIGGNGIPPRAVPDRRYAPVASFCSRSADLRRFRWLPESAGLTSLFPYRPGKTYTAKLASTSKRAG